MSLRAIVPILVVTLIGEAAAQERCRATDTPRVCFERWVPARVTTPDAPAARAVKTVLASVNGGAADLNAPVQATLKDFLSILSASLDTAVMGEDTTGLAFGYTPPVDLGGHLRLEAKFAKPQLSAQTLANVGGPAQKELEASLTALDDVTWALSYDWTTRTFGRSVERHLPLLGALVPPRENAQEAFVQALAASAIAPADAGKSFRQLNVDAGAFENLVRGTPTPIESDFASLLSNQPQLYATGSYEARRDIVGPSARGAAVTLELAGRNLNGFYRNEGRDCRERCVEALQAYLARIGDPRNAPRIALSLAYREVADVNTIVYSLSVGAPFASQDGRLELGVQYDGTATRGELVRTGFLRANGEDFEVPRLAPPRERLVGAVSYTHALSDRVTIPVSFVYAEVEYTLPTAGAVQLLVRDRESSVRLGVRYRLPNAGRASARPCCC